MSHVVVIDLVVRDLDVLDEACNARGVQLVRDQHAYRKWGGEGNCDHAICVPENHQNAKSAYQIGVVRQEDGFTLEADFYNGGYGIEPLVGANASGLCDEYSAIYTQRNYESDGFYVTRHTNEQGEIWLEATR